MAKLVRDYAVGRGFPEDRIVLETLAGNTSEHRTSLLERNLIAPGASMASSLPPGIFDAPNANSSDISIPYNGATSRKKSAFHALTSGFFPHEDSLTASTAYIRELVGLAS